MTVISVPASTANLGAGFDALGMALDLRARVGLPGTAADPGAREADAQHPLAVAFAAAGGEGQLWVRSPIPAGRGLGFSGAMRVAGVVAATNGALVIAGPDLRVARHRLGAQQGASVDDYMRALVTLGRLGALSYDGDDANDVGDGNGRTIHNYVVGPDDPSRLCNETMTSPGTIGWNPLGAMYRYIGGPRDAGINAAALCAAVEFGLQPELFSRPDGTPLYAPFGLGSRSPRWRSPTSRLPAGSRPS